MQEDKQILHIIGAGLAGSEAAWQAAQAGIQVILHEMRPSKMTPAHKTNLCAELVCSNSFRSDDANNNAVGLLHAELRDAGSLIMQVADKHKVPAGSALAISRDDFAQEITNLLHSHPNITICEEEITSIPESWQQVIIATGPLTSDALAQEIQQLAGQTSLSFFDAIAPILHFDSVNMDICWFQSRYDKGEGKDYINCPMDKQQYHDFIDALLAAEKVSFHEWENVPYFDGCLPIEVMAERGVETLRHGPMKPRGLTNAHQPTIKPYAVVQLRQDNRLGTLYNMVGFQTKLKYGEQSKIFKTIPGLEQAEFARLGGLHRNSYINSPQLLTEKLELKTKPHIQFAGQITGCEGYVESTTVGLLASYFAIAKLRQQPAMLPPITTAFGALLNHITKGHISHEEESKRSFQPMNINFGLFPPIDLPEEMSRKEKSSNRKLYLTSRGRADFKEWMAKQNILKAATAL